MIDRWLGACNGSLLYCLILSFRPPAWKAEGWFLQPGACLAPFCDCSAKAKKTSIFKGFPLLAQQCLEVSLDRWEGISEHFQHLDKSVVPKIQLGMPWMFLLLFGFYQI